MKICPKCQTRYNASVQFCSADSEVLVTDASVLVGTTLDGIFLIEALLGEGAMGAVYRAKHLALGDTVAIKLLKLAGGTSDDGKWLRRFQREGRAARRFRHPNVVAVHDLRVTPDGVAYLVLEYVEGRTLRQELRNGRLRYARVLRILGPLANALDAGHRSGVVHRDLKPDNVMIARGVDGEPLVKLLDLGIAKLVGVDELGVLPASTLTQAGQILGTPHYMSPEQWGERPKDGGVEIDGRADVYSLAVTTFELLTGTWPIRGSDVHAVRAGHLAGSVASVREVAYDLPSEVDTVIRHGMALDRQDRYPTAAAFVDALLAIAAAHPELGSQDDVPTQRTPRPEDEPTALFSSGDRAKSPLTSVWAGDIPLPGAINSEQTDAGIPEMVPAAVTVRASTPATLGFTDEVRGSRVSWSAVAAFGAGVLVVGSLGVWALQPFGSPPPPNAVLPAPVVRVADAACLVEIVDADGTVRAGTLEPSVVAGESVRLRLRTAEPEYVYILVTGRGNVPTLLLGDLPPADAGVESNRTVPGMDFPFPSPAGKLDRIAIGSDSRTTPLTLIVSRTSLAQLGWPGAEAPHELSPREREAFEQLVASAVEASDPTVDASTGMVQIRRPENSASRPLVLTINVTNSNAKAP